MWGERISRLLTVLGAESESLYLFNFWLQFFSVFSLSGYCLIPIALPLYLFVTVLFSISPLISIKQKNSNHIMLLFICAHHSEVAVPSVIVLNTSNEQYFLPSEPMESMEQLITFIKSVRDGTAQVMHT